MNKVTPISEEFIKESVDYAEMLHPHSDFKLRSAVNQLQAQSSCDFRAGAEFAYGRAYEQGIRDAVKLLKKENGKSFAADDSADWYADFISEHFGLTE